MQKQFAQEFAQELEAGLMAVREAATLCRRVQQAISTDVLEKKDRSPVTVADFGSQALICRRLRQAFPNDPIISEESSAALRKTENEPLAAKVLTEVRLNVNDAEPGDVWTWIDHGKTLDYSKRFWTLDPIDGTKGFLRGEQYAVSLSLIVEGQVVLGILGCPNLRPELHSAETGALFFATRGDGAHVTPLWTEFGEMPLAVSATTDSSQARFCESVESAHSAHGEAATVARKLGISAEPVRMDSQAKYAVVARGEADLYLRLPTRKDYREKIWDHAAGVLLVMEAGGQVTDAHGRELDFTKGSELTKNQGILASNRQLHAATLAALTETVS